MRMHRKPWAKHELAVNSKIVHDPQQYIGNWSTYFGNANPIHLELGCGKGRFISQVALLNPSVNHIAIERQTDVLAMAVRLADTMGASPAFINTDVKHLPELFAPGEISRIYINFCDPWPNRKKWAKRRLTHSGFLALYESLFNGSGEVFFKTDNRQLFEFSINQFSESGWIMRNVSLDLHHSVHSPSANDTSTTCQSLLPVHRDCEENIMTEYEEKFSSKGNPIYRLEAYCKCRVSDVSVSPADTLSTFASGKCRVSDASVPPAGTQ